MEPIKFERQVVARGISADRNFDPIRRCRDRRRNQRVRYRISRPTPPALVLWLRQRRFEERMRNLTELHKLSARLFEYLGPDWATGELTGADSRERNTEIEDALAREWHAVADQTEFLFGAPAYQKLQSFMAKFPRVLFRRLPDHPEKAVDVWDDFVRARHVAFESLYADLFTNK
jgi:hypothetical protein